VENLLYALEISDLLKGKEFREFEKVLNNGSLNLVIKGVFNNGSLNLLTKFLKGKDRTLLRLIIFFYYCLSCLLSK
jgi:hypothetical protein